MAKCVAKACKRQLQAGWSFCPYCGTDNRPPTFRPVLVACPHRFIKGEGFCFRCGDCRDGRPTAAQREKQASIGRTCLLLGILLIVAAVAVVQIRTNALPGSVWIRSWYDQAYDAGGGKGYRGDDYVLWAQMGGGALCGIGILALLVAKLNGVRRKRIPAVEKPKPEADPPEA